MNKASYEGVILAGSDSTAVRALDGFDPNKTYIVFCSFEGVSHYELDWASKMVTAHREPNTFKQVKFAFDVTELSPKEEKLKQALRDARDALGFYANNGHLTGRTTQYGAVIGKRDAFKKAEEAIKNIEEVLGD